MGECTGRGANGPVRIPHLTMKNGQGLINWARTRHRLGQSLDSRLFTQEELDDMVAALEAVDERAARGDDTAPSKPGKFVPDKWVQWDKAFNAHLGAIPSSAPEAPLSHVIRNDACRPDNVNEVPRREQLFWDIARHGNNWKNIDSPRVHNVLHELVLDTLGLPWLDAEVNRDNGTAAHESMRNHCDGPDQKRARIASAHAALKQLH